MRRFVPSSGSWLFCKPLRSARLFYEFKFEVLVMLETVNIDLVITSYVIHLRTKLLFKKKKESEIYKESIELCNFVSI